MTGKSKAAGDEALGMDASITRRDFLGSTLLASGAALLPQQAPAQTGDDFTGYGGLGDYANSNGNTREVVLAGHQMRDGVFDGAEAVDVDEIYDCVVVGGGISGLAAAITFLKEGGPRKNVLILENHPIFGGEAKRNEFEVDGKRLIAHQGSAIYFVPYPHSVIGRFYESIGLGAPRLQYQRWDGPGTLGRTPYESAQYGFWFAAPHGARDGIWVMDPVKSRLKGAPLSDHDRGELLRWLGGNPGVVDTPPQYEGDEISRRLDSITLEQHYMNRFGIARETSRKYLTAVEGGAYGLGPDALSAYTDYAFDMLHPLGDESDSAQMFPGGNAGIARLMIKTLNPAAIEGEHTIEGVHRGRVRFDLLDTPEIPARVRLSSTVVSVKHNGDPKSSDSLSVVYSRAGRLYRVKARSAVVAGGSWTAKHIVKDLPASHATAYAQFHRSPCLMANVAVRNTRFLQKLGITGCRWFDGFGTEMNLYRSAVIADGDGTLSAG